MNLLNNTQHRLFKSLIGRLDDENIDVHRIKTFKNIPEFKICEKIIEQVIKKHMSNKDNKQPSDVALHDMLIEYEYSHGKKYLRAKINEVVMMYARYLENDYGKVFYFLPLYNFEFDGYELIIDDSIKIRNILESEREYLIKQYDGMPILPAIRRVSHVFIINVSSDGSPRDVAITKARQTINMFTLIKRGGVRLGGMYSFGKSENWNPANRFDRIFFEPTNTYSKHRYLLRKRDKGRFQGLLGKIGKRYPARGEDDKYGDYFDRVIRRFNSSLDNKGESEKIVDLVLTLEILLVSSPGENTLKLSQRTAMFIGADDQEKQAIWNYMKSLYNFRSGQVHEFKDKKIRTKGTPPSTKEEALQKLCDWSRRAILQMILLSLDVDNLGRTPNELYEKVDECMFDKDLNAKIGKLGKTTRALLNC